MTLRPIFESPLSSNAKGMKRPSCTVHLVLVLEGRDYGCVFRNCSWGSYAPRKSAQPVTPVGSQRQSGLMSARRSGLAHA